MTTPANADFVYAPVILNRLRNREGDLNLLVATNPALFAEMCVCVCVGGNNKEIRATKFNVKQAI